MIRSGVRYKEEIFSIAAAIVAKLGGFGFYTALHVRRNELQVIGDARLTIVALFQSCSQSNHQYKEVFISAAQMLSNIRPLLKKVCVQRMTYQLALQVSHSIMCRARPSIYRLTKTTVRSLPLCAKLAGWSCKCVSGAM